jgi:thioredoxin-related protein
MAPHFFQGFRMKRLLELSLNLLCLVLVSVGVFAYFRERRPAEGAKQRAVSGIRTGQKLVIPGVAWPRRKSLVLALSTTCHFCEQSAPFYQKLLEEQKKGTWQSILLFPQQTQQAVNYVDKHNYYSPTTLHANFTALGVTGTPTLVLVDDMGTVLDEWIGLLSPKEEADVATHLGIVRAAHELSKKVPLILYCNFAPWCQANGIRTLCSSAEETIGEEGI